MTTPRTTSKMTCMGGCRRTLAWPDAFPNTTYAVCWRCSWDDHQRRAHPPKKHWRLRWPIIRVVTERRPAP